MITIGCLFLLKEHYDVFAKSAIIGTTITNEYNVPLGPVWFLLALFWCRIIYRTLAEYMSVKWRSIIITTIALTILLIKLCVWEDLYKCPWNILQGIVCMFYYHVGVLLQDSSGLVKLRELKSERKRTLIVVSCSLLALSVLAFWRLGTNMNLSMLQTPLLPIDLLNAIGLTLSLYLVICFICKHLKVTFLQSGLRWCGEHSMAIFAVHCVEYHTTVRIVSRLTGTMMEVSDNVLEKILVLPINPLVQVIICVLLVLLWEFFKGLKLQHIKTN